MAMPAWLTASIEADEIKEAEAQNFDPLDLQYQYPSGYTVRESYDDP